MPAYHARKHYDEDEREHLRRRYPHARRAVLARELGRSPQAVSQQASGMGLSKRPTLAACEAELRRLHAAGLLDSQIAPLLGLSQGYTVGRWRKALGLPCNLDKRARGKLAQKALRRKALLEGAPTWGRLTAQRRRLAADAAERGCVSMTQVDLCAALRLHGPLRVGEAARLSGRDPSGVSRALADLLAAGVVRKDGGAYHFVPACLRAAARAAKRGRR
jgi:hypothetical protein